VSRHVRVPLTDLRAIAFRVSQGLSTWAAEARPYGCSPTTIYRHVHLRVGPTRAPRCPPSANEARDLRAVTARNAGNTWADVATIAGFKTWQAAETAARRYAKKHGMSLLSGHVSRSRATKTETK